MNWKASLSLTAKKAGPLAHLILKRKIRPRPPVSLGQFLGPQAAHCPAEQIVVKLQHGWLSDESAAV
jgi:hypothetical protein